MTNATQIRMKLAATFLALAALAAGCGGGGTSSASSVPGASEPAPAAEALVWTPPTTYFDNTPLNPQSDLAYYEIYVGTSPTFTDNDAPVAAIAAVEMVRTADGRTTPRATSSFNLTNIAPLVEPGRSYYVSVRAVGNDNLVSSFSPAVEWELG